MKKDKRAVVLAYMLALVLMFGLTVGQVSAERKSNIVPNIDMSRDFSLTIDYHYSNSGSKILLNNVKFKVCKVADLTVIKGSAEYKLTKDFIDTKIDFKGMTASDSNLAAKEFNAIAKSKNINRISKNTNDEGKVTFNGLTPGMYLVVQSKIHKQGNENYISEPFLVSVPLALDNSEENIWQYAVIAQPKLSTKKEIKQPTPKPPTPSPKPSKTKTDDPFKLKLWGLILTGAGIIMVSLLRFKRKNN